MLIYAALINLLTCICMPNTNGNWYRDYRSFNALVGVGDCPCRSGQVGVCTGPGPASCYAPLLISIIITLSLSFKYAGVVQDLLPVHLST